MTKEQKIRNLKEQANNIQHLINVAMETRQGVGRLIRMQEKLYREIDELRGTQMCGEYVFPN